MNSKNIIAIPKEVEGKICMSCLEKSDNISKIRFNKVGYGSVFDGDDTEIHLCDSCKEKVNIELWCNELIIKKDENGRVLSTKYKFEDKLITYLNSLPIEGRELVFNRFNKSWICPSIDSQDWIDQELDE